MIFDNSSLKLAVLKACIVLVPSYAMAYFTDKMVWVVPTLAAAGFFAGTITLDKKSIRRRVDEEDGEGGDYTHNTIDNVDG